MKLAAAIMLAMTLCSPAMSRGHEDSPLHSWFDQLASGRGLCCSFADGQTVEDVDWDARDGRYRVYLRGLVVSGINIPDGWVEVPDEAVVTTPNKFGPAVIWPYLMWEGTGMPSLAIRCFLPGAGT